MSLAVSIVLEGNIFERVHFYKPVIGFVAGTAVRAAVIELESFFSD